MSEHHGPVARIEEYAYRVLPNGDKSLHLASLVEDYDEKGRLLYRDEQRHDSPAKHVRPSWQRDHAFQYKFSYTSNDTISRIILMNTTHLEHELYAYRIATLNRSKDKTIVEFYKHSSSDIRGAESPDPFPITRDIESSPDDSEDHSGLSFFWDSYASLFMDEEKTILIDSFRRYYPIINQPEFMLVQNTASGLEVMYAPSGGLFQAFAAKVFVPDVENNTISKIFMPLSDEAAVSLDGTLEVVYDVGSKLEKSISIPKSTLGNIFFSEIEYDEYGNWIRRKATFLHPQRKYKNPYRQIHERVITYR
jgi:hypothetical protein